MLTEASAPWAVHRRFRHMGTTLPPLMSLDRPVVCGVHGDVVGRGMGLLDELLNDIQSASVEPRLKPLLAFVRKLTLTPGDMTQADADAVFDAGWDEKALHDAIAITARMCFIQRLVEGHGFIPLSPEVAKKHARKRVELGYVNLYPAFAKGADKTSDR